MTIKSDRWIKDQCEMTHMRAGHLATQEIMSSLQPQTVLADIRGNIRERKDEIRAEFKPMIHPFVGEQVRMRDRATPSEAVDGLTRRLASAKEYRQKVVDSGLGMNCGFLDLEIRRIERELDKVGTPELEPIISYGLSSYGYDVRCGRKFKIFTNVNSGVIDPKDFDPKCLVDVEVKRDGEYVIIPPNSFALASTVEYMRIPRNVLVVCIGKSTYARTGMIVNVTPLEPEWEGNVTLEFSNTTPLPMKVYAGEGCAQMMFFESDEPCEVSYADRKGKYQYQAAEPVPPKV